VPAKIVPNEAIPGLAARIDSPVQLRVLRHLQEAGFLMNGEDVDPRLAEALQRLADLGLVDPGYDGTTNGEPYLWVSNANGSRVLRHLEAASPRPPALESHLAVHPRAHTALAVLSEWDRLKVLSAVEALQGSAPVSWPREEVVRLEEGKPVYLLRVPPDLRAFIRVLESGEIELIDIVREETLQLFRGR
jgi:hypothetical protein